MARKSPQTEINKRIRLIAELIIAGYTVYDISQQYAKDWGVAQRQVYAYAQRAEKLIEEAAKTKLEYEIAKAQRRYEAIYRGAMKVKQYASAVAAVRGICELRGLNRREPDDGKPIAVDFNFKVVD